MTQRPPLPDINAPLPIIDDEVKQEEDHGMWGTFTTWWKGLLNKNSETFAAGTGENNTNQDEVRERFTLRQCCNWNNVRTRLLLMAILDILSSMYGLASANRVRLISTLLNITGIMFMWILAIGMCITAFGIYGIITSHSKIIRVFFYWSICSLVLNFILSSIDLTTIDKQCDFIWNNFDHSAYAEKDRQLFARQCESYAFVFFSVVMVGIAFARLYYVWLIRGFYISITPDHEGYGQARGGYSKVATNGRITYSGSAVNHADDD